MAKKNMPEAASEKVQTKYDRKMEARKQQKIKEKRQDKITKTAAAVIGIALAAAIVISTAASIVNKQRALHDTYVKIGTHELTQLEYDYYYESAVNSYFTSYGSLLSYMGVDTSADLDEQEYMDTGLTWKDMFDEMTVEQIKQNKALLDDASAQGFTYDTAEDYESFVSSISEAASSAGVSVKDYYKEYFGAYATEENLESYIKESLFINAYYNELLETKAPSEEEVHTYYEENTQSYDQVDYRSFTFTADIAEDAAEEEITEAMDDLEAQAQAMMQERQDGGDFEELCIAYASEEAKADYEDTETEYSLTEGSYYTSIAAEMAEWLFEEGRGEGDLTVIRDDDARVCYVVEFVNRYYDEANDESISNTLATQNVTEYISALAENYEVVDVRGELKYLTAETEEAEEVEETEDIAE